MALRALAQTHVTRLLCLLTVFAVLAGPARADEAAWAALAGGGHVALMRHATAPGVGDPEDFRIGDCGTQRNLSAGGRAQAKAIGDAFRARTIREAPIFASGWCRCEETARLLGLGPVEIWPELNSFFRQGRSQEEAQTEQLRARIAALDTQGAAVLVTHQVNITALTGVFPASGETVVLRRDLDGALTVVGRIAPPE
jgi:phosphohistidine phosphatase SixA